MAKSLMPEHKNNSRRRVPKKRIQRRYLSPFRRDTSTSCSLLGHAWSMDSFQCTVCGRVPFSMYKA